MLVHLRVTHQQYVAVAHLYTGLKRDKVDSDVQLSKETTRRARLEPQSSQPRPQGAFPWLWRWGGKRPWNRPAT